MALSEEDLRALVAKASSASERVEAELVPVAKVDDPEAAERWRLWCETLVKGEWAVFRRRLEWDGLDEARVRPRLGEVRLPDDATLPSWTSVLRAACEEATRAPSNPTPAAFLDPTNPYPFEDVLAPFVTVATQRVETSVRGGYRRLTPLARRTLERDLLKWLTHYAAQSLYLELTVERASAVSVIGRIALEADSHAARDVYELFAGSLRRDGMRTFFVEYAVLARQLARMTELWIDASTEFLGRLEADWTVLAETFGNAGQLHAAVTAIDVGLSDPHAGRRTVMALTLDTGRKIVYKPKSIDTEQAFQDLLGWLGALGEILEMRTTRVIARAGYGWAEFVEYAPCQDRDAASRYFRRAGILLCLVYVLEGVDCHRDNLIACGEYPVLVDCEGLMQPRQRVDDMADDVLARFLAQEQLSHSVLRSGMLPHFQVRGSGANRKVYDISALGGFHDEEEEARRLTWTHPNTDAMQVGWTTVKFRVSACGPKLDGRALGLAEFCDEVVEGFRAMYGVLVRHRDALLDADGPIARLARQPVRFIFRNTQTYGLLTNKLLDPDYQRDGVLRGIELDKLSLPHIPPAATLDQQIEAPVWWPLFGAEVAAMQREDVPYFGARPTSNVLLVASDREVSGLFQGPSVDLVVDRFRGLGPEDLERQVSFIGASLYGVMDGQGPRRIALPAAPEVLCAPSFTEMTEEAVRLAEQIARGAVRAGDSATWIAPQFVFRSERYLLYSLQNDLYTGLGGVAVFLAAAARVAAAPELEQLAYHTVSGLRRKMATGAAKLADLIGIGGATGMGSVVYTFTNLGRTLGDESFFVDARRAAESITPARIESDATLDICDGSAGAILALVSLYEATRDASVLDRARNCARHIVEATVRADDGRVGWVTILDKVMVGFSHGIAGIAYALLRLYRVTGDDELLKLASDSMAYEDSLFDEVAGNWPDLRRDHADSFDTASWCHGGAGIALGRIGGLPSLNNEAMRRDIDRGIALMSKRPLYGVDYACCGNIGLSDILVSAAVQLDRPDVHDIAVRRAWQTVLRARASGAFALDPVLPRQMLNPSYFQGVSGIGYTLLRLVRPDLPSVLLWA